DHTVEQVENLPPEIETEPLGEVETLLQRGVFTQVGLNARIPIKTRRVAQGVGLRDDDTIGVTELRDRTDRREVTGVTGRRPVIRIVGGVHNPAVQGFDQRGAATTEADRAAGQLNWLA